MGLCDDVRERCAAVAASARHVRIDVDRLDAVEPGPATRAGPGEPLPGRLRGGGGAVHAGAGRHQLRLGLVSHHPQAARVLGVDHHRPRARPSTARGRRRTWQRLDAAAVAAVLGQDPDHELMGLYAMALNELGEFLGDRSALDVVAEAGGSAEALAAQLAARHAHVRRPRLLQARADPARRPGAGRRGRVRRPGRADDLRRQPGSPRAARGRRAGLRRRSWRRGSTPASCCRPGPRSGRSAPAPCTPASCWRRGWACRRGRWTTGSGTAASSRATRRCRATARGRPPTSRVGPLSWTQRAAAGSPPAAALQRRHVAPARAACRSARPPGPRARSPGGQALERVGDRVGQVGPVGVRALGPAARRPAPGGRGCRPRSSSAGTSWMTTELAPILAQWPDLDRAEQLGARSRPPRRRRPSGGACRAGSPVPPSVTPW